MGSWISTRSMWLIIEVGRKDIQGVESPGSSSIKWGHCTRWVSKLVLWREEVRWGEQRRGLPILNPACGILTVHMDMRECSPLGSCCVMTTGLKTKAEAGLWYVLKHLGETGWSCQENDWRHNCKEMDMKAVSCKSDLDAETAYGVWQDLVTLQGIAGDIRSDPRTLAEPMRPPESSFQEHLINISFIHTEFVTSLLSGWNLWSSRGM